MGRIANAFVGTLLRSPLHPALSSGVLLLTFRGRRSGRSYTTPVQYAVDGDTLVVVPGHAERKQWWRNLRGGASVRVRVAGRDLEADAEVVDGEDADSALAAYLDRFPKARAAVSGQHLAVVVRPRSP